MSAEAPRAGTTASVEARVERLESTVGGLVVDIALVKAAQSNLNTLVTSQHVALTTQIAALAGELRQFLQAAAQQASEPQATPAGRSILQAIRERDLDREKEHAIFERGIERALSEGRSAKVWIAAATGALGVIVLLVNLLAPSILKFLGV